MRLLHGETLRVKRYAMNPHGELSLVSEHSASNCAVLIRSSSEPLNVRNDVVTTATLLAPYGTDLNETDRVVQADGTEWDVIGKPSHIQSPLTGWKPGMRATLQHVSG